MGAQRGLRFVALGDSTTVGIGDPDAAGAWRGWARLLADSLASGQPLSFTNLAVSGATAASVRAGQLDQALAAKPRLASLVVGVNDTMRSTWDPGRVRDDVHACVGALTEAGAVVLSARFHDHGAVFGLPAVLRRPLWRRIEQVNEAFDEAHVVYGGLRIDLTREPIVYAREFWSVDRLHPGELGHRRLAYEFAVGLRGLGYTVDCAPLLAAGGEVPTAWRDLMWLVTAGAPWMGRRARDLGPWAARLAVSEALTRLRTRATAA